MSKSVITIVSLLFSLGLVLLGLIIKSIKPEGSALVIESTPSSKVYINDQSEGDTPLKLYPQANEVRIKLVPPNTESSYEVKVKLNPDVTTIVRKNFGESNVYSSGELISFEKATASEVGLTVITDPDQSLVTLDGSALAISPFKKTDLKAGVHQLTVRKNGFVDNDFQINLIKGYNLTAIVSLAKNKNSETLPIISPPSVEENTITILKSAGFLSAHEKSTIESAIVGLVQGGKKYKVIDETSSNDWVKIEVQSARNGWIEKKYIENTTS